MKRPCERASDVMRVGCDCGDSYLVKCRSRASMLRWRMHIRVRAEPTSLVAPGGRRGREGGEGERMGEYWRKIRETVANSGTDLALIRHISSG